MGAHNSAKHAELRREDQRSQPKILVLTTTLPAAQGDGTPEFVLSLAASLADSFQITVLGPRTPQSRREERVAGVDVIRFPYFVRRFEGVADGAILPNLRAKRWRWVEVPFLLGSFWWHALLVARRQRPDLVHAHWIIPAGLVALVLKKLLGQPYVVTIHGADAYSLRGLPWNLLKRRVIREAATVCPVSRDIASTLGLDTSGKASPVVPMGVDVDSIRRSVGERASVRGRFVFVGRLAEKKGVDVVIGALASVPEAHLVVVGEGPERSTLEKLARRLGVEHRVRFTGQLPRERVFQHIRQAHAMVIPSRVAPDGDQEGTPVVLAEGMAAGVPIIASRLGGLAEYVIPGVNGFLVSPGSVDSLASALRMSLSKTERFNTYGLIAQQQMPEDLDLRTTRDQYRRFFSQVLSYSGGFLLR